MTNDVHEAAQRLLTTINGIHVGVQVQPGKVIATADVIEVCQWALPLLDSEPITEAAIRALGWVEDFDEFRFDIPGDDCRAYSVAWRKRASQIYIGGGSNNHQSLSPTPIKTLGQFRLLLAALSAGEGK